MHLLDLGLAVLAQKHLEVAELLQQRLVLKELNVLDVVVRLVFAGVLLLGVARIDAFEDAQTSAAHKKRNSINLRPTIERQKGRKLYLKSFKLI